MESAGPGAAVAPPPAERGERTPALEVALLALIGFLPTLVAGYVYDDLLLVRDNRYTHGLNQLGRAFSTYFWQLGATGSGGLRYYRPLVTTTYILDWIVSSGKPWFFHFENAVAHAAVTYLVVVLARRWTGRPLLAVAIGLIVAFHPSRTESVVWIAGRTDVLMTLFLLLSVEAAFAASAREDARGRRQRLALSVLMFVLALLCKEAAVILPLLLLPDLLSCESALARTTLRRNLLAAAGIVGAFVALRVFVFPVREAPLEFTPRYGLMTVAAYAERVLVPWPQTFFHRPLVWGATGWVYPLPLVVGGAVLTVAYAALTLAAFRKDKVAGVLLVSAAVAFGPLLNFTYTGIFVTTSDHFLYLPLALFLLGIARRYEGPLSRWATIRAVRWGFVNLVAVYFTMDLVRGFDFSDQTAIYRHELALNPENPLVLKSLSEEKARVGEIDQAFQLLLASTGREAMKYRLLMPEWLAYQSYFRLLALQAARTADGNVRDLTLLYRELCALLDGGSRIVRGEVGELSLGQRLPKEEHALALAEGTREILSAETGFLATRLGDDARARKLLDGLGEDDLDVIPNAQNVALAYARLEDFQAARRWISWMSTRLAARYPDRSLDPLRKRLDQAEGLFHQARAARGAERHRLRGEAFVELGAYLRALRELRRAYESTPNAGALGPLYVHVLVAAGLDEDATAVATRALGPEEAEALVKRTRAELSPHLKKLRRAATPGDWYGTPSPEEAAP